MEALEYEGTVVRSAAAMDMGEFEALLRPKFMTLDLLKEANDVYIGIYNLQQAVVKWNEVSLTSLLSAWDEQAIKITENKEEYLTKKKSLASAVRSFSAKYLSNISDDSSWQAECKELVETFKLTVDVLLKACKFSETSFLSTYKILNDVSDPVPLFEDCVSVCIRAQDALKKGQEQLNIANDLINAPSNHNNVNNEEYNNTQHDTVNRSELKELEIKLQEERLAIRSRIELEIRTREHMVKSQYESELLALQQKMDNTIEMKDNEIASLHRFINLNNVKDVEKEIRNNTIDNEINKRKDLEDKLRSTITELTTSHHQIHELTKKYDALVTLNDTNTASYSKQINQLQSAVDSQHATISDLNMKITKLHEDIGSRPPVDMQSFLSKINIYSNHDGARDTSVISWERAEELLLQAFYKYNNDVSETRVSAQEALTQVTNLKNENEMLLQKNNTLQSSVHSLEQEVHNMQRFVNNNSSGSSGNHSGKYSPGKLANIINEPENEGSNGNTLLSTLQSQRDRYMKLVREKEQEIIDHKQKLDRLQEDQLQLRSENLELYRRLRILRKGENIHQSTPSKLKNRSKYNNHDVESNNEAVESKYEKLYEEKIDPFKLEEFDRQHIISSMNVFERYLAYTVRFLLQDQFARHVLMVYLVLVHIFACGYVIQVLNPQLIDEVDHNLKAKWAEETLNNIEHPDN